MRNADPGSETLFITKTTMVIIFSKRILISYSSANLLYSFLCLAFGLLAGVVDGAEPSHGVVEVVKVVEEMVEVETAQKIRRRRLSAVVRAASTAVGIVGFVAARFVRRG